jgi:type VI secretion system secreted protein Hcp
LSNEAAGVWFYTVYWQRAILLLTSKEEWMPIYMNWGDSKPPEIRGDVTESGHLGWIELRSAQLGAHRSISNATSGRESAAPSVTEITITKVQDTASATLFQESLFGQGKNVAIDFVKTDTGKPRVYLSLKLSDTLISSYNVSGRDGQESLTLNFTKIEYGSAPGVQPHGAQWNLGKPSSAGASH